MAQSKLRAALIFVWVAKGTIEARDRVQQKSALSEPLDAQSQPHGAAHAEPLAAGLVLQWPPCIDQGRGTEGADL